MIPMHLVAICIVTCLAAFTDCRIVLRRFRLQNGWAFLQKFAFFSNQGGFKLSISLDSRFDSNLVLVIINVVNDTSWKQFYLRSPSCNDIANTNLNHLTFPLRNISTVVRFGNITTIYDVHNIAISTSVPTYSFSMLLSCDSIVKNFSVYVNLLLTNGDISQFFRYHFSADEFYLLESLITFWIFYLCFLLALRYYKKLLKKESRQSVLTYLFYMVITVKFVVFTAQIIILLIYGGEGLFNYTAFMIFEIFNELDVLLFMELLILLGFGLTVVFGKLSLWISTLVIVTGILYAILIIIVISVDISNYSTVFISSMYDQFSGYCLVTIEFAMAITLVCGCSWIIYQYRSRRLFYGIYMTGIFIWFISVPILILVSINNIGPYLRFSLVIIVRNSLDFLAHLFYFLITYPKLFPSLVIYTTPAHVIATATWENSVKDSEEEPADIQTNNQQFFNLAEFQAPARY